MVKVFFRVYDMGYKVITWEWLLGLKVFRVWDLELSDRKDACLGIYVLLKVCDVWFNGFEASWLVMMS